MILVILVLFFKFWNNNAMNVVFELDPIPGLKIPKIAVNYSFSLVKC